MTGFDVLGLKDPNPGLSYKTSYAHPYPSSSVSSSASSSSSSVFSLDGVSTQGSISSTSTNPVDVIWEHDGEYPAGRGLASRACLRAPIAKPADAPVAPELRKHPRRTSVPASNARPPPCLMRQSERKVNFVDNLVDTASQIVEIIWPLSAVSLRSDSATGCKGVLPLRTFIQETLRRSRTSYSTLQVALYYLIKIKPHVPSHDLTQDQARSKPGCRAMQCGRRMFLAALILASKYLQDRNYSARAWSKISGLPTPEINQNELMFLQAVDWKLHITEATFQRWTDIVLKYTPGAGALALEGYTWRSVIPRLTPDLEEMDVAPMTPPVSVAGSDVRSMADSPSPRGSSTRGGYPRYAAFYAAGELERMPEARTAPTAVDSFNPSLPSIPRPPMLPTPQMTPQSSMATTPAASAGSYPPHRRNICSAMSQVQNMCMARSTLDQRPSLPFCPKTSNGSFDGYPTMVRRSSLARSTSSASSPDSMISDVSTLSSQSSRSSSMSSASGSGGVVLPRLAVQAALRSTNNTMKENRKPLAIASPIDETALSGLYQSSPLDGYGGVPTAVPDLSNFTLGTPVDMASTHEAAQGLCALSGAVASRQHHATGSQRRHQGRKRGRTGSEDFPLQNHVRQLVHSSGIREGTVLPDGKMADIFLNSGPRRSQSLTATQLKALNSYAPLSGPVGMKRACCGSEANKIALNPTMRAEYLG